MRRPHSFQLQRAAAEPASGSRRAWHISDAFPNIFVLVKAEDLDPDKSGGDARELGPKRKYEWGPGSPEFLLKTSDA